MKTSHPSAIFLLPALFFGAGAFSLARGQTTPPPKHPPVRVRPAPSPVKPPDPARPQFGDPLPGLTQVQLTAFFAGKDNFQEIETIESGLGPIFNRDSCVGCHSSPIVGGSSNIVVTRFGQLTGTTFDPLESLGGSLQQSDSILGRPLEFIPQQANVVAHRRTTALFGLGLIEAIPDAAIQQLAAAKKPDGVKGRAAMIVDAGTGQTRVGRFGWKAQHSSLLTFAGDAYLNEMGITNRIFPTENAPNGNTALLAQLDTVSDPEDPVDATGKADIDRFADFMRFMAPPPPVPLTKTAQTGAGLFQQIGCAVCHTPQWTTAANPAVGALSTKPVLAYSDFLLHDMGSLNDNIGQAGANPNEMKTPVLWGVRASNPYLHDGRAATLDQAISAHDGEGKTARDRYVGLSTALKANLIEFLNSL